MPYFYMFVVENLERSKILLYLDAKNVLVLEGSNLKFLENLNFRYALFAINVTYTNFSTSLFFERLHYSVCALFLNQSLFLVII